MDHARGKAAEKRGGGAARVTLGGVELEAGPLDDLGLLDLDAALERLEELSPRQRQVVELRFFAGLTDSTLLGNAPTPLSVLESLETGQYPNGGAGTEGARSWCKTTGRLCRTEGARPLRIRLWHGLQGVLA